jgi:hypothetical protein
MDDDKANDLQGYLMRRIPDVRVSNYYDFERGAQRFRIRHGRLAEHILMVDDAAAERYSREELQELVDKSIRHLRLTESPVEVRIEVNRTTVQKILR